MLFDDLSPLMQWFLAHLIVQSGNDEIAGDIRENGANIVLTVNGFELPLESALNELNRQRVEALHALEEATNDR